MKILWKLLTRFLKQLLIHLIHLDVLQRLLLVMIGCKVSNSIFQIALVFLKSRKNFNFTQDFLYSMFVRLLQEKL